jgi:hypothetical protein
MRQRSFLAVSLLALGAVGTAHAEPSSSELAADHFQHGLSHARAGEIDAAATDFEAAYKVSPNFAVLYNLGRTYAAMGRAVDAVDAFNRYLSEGGSSIDPKRREEVAESIALNEKRIGQAEIQVEPASAEVSIDGRVVALTGGSLRLVSGEHVLVATAPGFRSATRPFVVRHNAANSLRVQLSADPPPAASRAWLSIACAVPGVAVSVDDVARGDTPVRTPLGVSEGPHRIAFQRRGYTRTNVDWSPSSFPTVDCGVKLDHVAAADAATLLLTPSETDAQVFIDGARWQHSPLPFGPHHLELKRFGFQTWARDIDLRPGVDAQLAVRLFPQPEYAGEHLRSIRQRRIAGYGLVGTGSALLVTAGALELLSSHAYEAWSRARDAADRTPGTSSSYQSLQQDAARQALHVRTLDDWSLGSAIAGSSLLIAGAVLLFTAEDPARYELPAARLTSSGMSMDWRHSF